MSMFQNQQKEIITEVLLTLSQKFGKQIELKRVDNLGGGCINNASKIETNAGNYFLKWNSDCASDIFLREAESLIELKNALKGNLVVPEVFDAKQVGSTPGYLVLEFLPAVYSTATDDEKLGRGLAFLHQKSNENFGFYNHNFCGATPQNNKWEKSWPVFFAQNRLQYLLNLIQKSRNFTVAELKTFYKLINKISGLLPSESVPSLIHGDLWAGNYMISANGPALVDPAAYYADREMEFSIITMFGGFSARFFAAYNEVFTLPAGWETRNRLYQLYHLLNHYYLFGGGYGRQALNIADSYL